MEMLIIEIKLKQFVLFPLVLKLLYFIYSAASATFRPSFWHLFTKSKNIYSYPVLADP